MKKIILLAVLSIAGLTATNAQTTKQTVKKAAAKVEAPKVDGPGMVFENETIDYGTITKGADGKREFVFVNNGTKPVTISNAQGSCGCTVPTKPDSAIAPGAKGVIGVKYDTNRVGPFTKTVTITSDASETPKVLTIKGTVVEDKPAGETIKS
ncbi:DUF1573 domain-containing protein [Flavobacterium capsici]|uniref:DUF1573 domain-containing protein n=1 Tax=Flavobacterium capsici TaxID=3075618 RepID=A0AA96J3X2_9FLAO|nr:MULTISPECIES: DUF1573 domain-containing protein [unclassified Flavobacterium]WNM19296.1 DUF1573 domain-containing protein [Flavobacterium sp. PMR2A8]WNM20685.1 DUF1573 domain-containing protein [Flavobacterium sp. PMTSA4]